MWGPPLPWSCGWGPLTNVVCTAHWVSKWMGSWPYVFANWRTQWKWCWLVSQYCDVPGGQLQLDQDLVQQHALGAEAGAKQCCISFNYVLKNRRIQAHKSAVTVCADQNIGFGKPWADKFGSTSICTERTLVNKVWVQTNKKST